MDKYLKGAFYLSTSKSMGGTRFMCSSGFFKNAPIICSDPQKRKCGSLLKMEKIR